MVPGTAVGGTVTGATVVAVVTGISGWGAAADEWCENSSTSAMTAAATSTRNAAMA
jgi:hypothetical protein